MNGRTRAARIPPGRLLMFFSDLATFRDARRSGLVAGGACRRRGRFPQPGFTRLLPVIHLPME